MNATYAYPMSGRYNETEATLADGRRMIINTQYDAVLPLGEHAGDCEQVVLMGGRCTCGKLDGVDVAALLADASANGKFGRAPKAAGKPQATLPESGACPKCGTYCNGDCTATTD